MRNALKAASIVASLVLLGAGCPSKAPVTPLPTAPPESAAQPSAPAVPTTEPVVLEDVLFDPLTIHVGDVVAGLKVASVSALHPEGPPEAENYRVAFTGRATVSGTYDYHFSDFGGDEVIFKPDADSLAKLPITKERRPHPELFLVGGLEKVLAVLGLKAGAYGTGSVTIVIEDYVVVWAPAEVMDSAVVVSRAEGRADAAPKPVSLEPYYVAYTADGASKALAQGRATVLYFWAAWCPICRADEPKIKARIEGSDLPVAGFRVNYDVESDLKAKYKIPYQHTAVFLDKAGVEVERLSGPVDDATFLAALKKATE
jgi:thioredoxin 1